jgi:hypothetical protein
LLNKNRGCLNSSGLFIMFELDPYLLIWLAFALFILALGLNVATAVLRDDDEAIRSETSGLPETKTPD